MNTHTREEKATKQQSITVAGVALESLIRERDRRIKHGK